MRDWKEIISMIFDRRKMTWAVLPPDMIGDLPVVIPKLSSAIPGSGHTLTADPAGFTVVAAFLIMANAELALPCGNSMMRCMYW